MGARVYDRYENWDGNMVDNKNGHINGNKDLDGNEGRE